MVGLGIPRGLTKSTEPRSMARGPKDHIIRVNTSYEIIRGFHRGCMCQGFNYGLVRVIVASWGNCKNVQMVVAT